MLASGSIPGIGNFLSFLLFFVVFSLKMKMKMKIHKGKNQKHKERGNYVHNETRET